MRHNLVAAWFASLFSLAAVSSGNAQEAIALFDGKSLNGWTTTDGKPVGSGWEVVDGTLHLSTSGQRGGDILTDQEYDDFVLEFEWKIAAKGNNGLKYRVRKYGNRVLGCEFQMLDDSAYVDQLPANGMTGSLYDIYEPNDAVVVRPWDEFNHTRIVVCGDCIQHWLNSRLIVSARVGSPEWHQRISQSKFADIDGFGENRAGKIMLTDHGSEVWYRNMILKPLPPPVSIADSAGRHKRGWRPRLCLQRFTRCFRRCR